MSVAALPMYDWPEVAVATDRLWDLMRKRLAEAGLAAPDRLSRGGNLPAVWTAPDLVIAQTCGYPFATVLKDRVSLVGTPAYAIGCLPGRYRSVLIVRKAARVGSLEELAGSRMAFNASDSQSGFQAPSRLFRASGLNPPTVTIETGSHRASIRSVAAGEADFAAIDAVSWRLALRHEPAADAVAAFAETPETPGLPLITSVANRSSAAVIFDCVAEAVEALDEETRDALLIEGLVATTPADYAPLATDA